MCRPTLVLTETTPLSSVPENAGDLLIRLRRLLDVSLALNAIADVDRLLDYIAETTTEVLSCEAASILLYDETDKALRFAAATGEAGQALVGMRIPVEGSLAGATFADDRILYAADATQDERRFERADEETGFVTRAMLCVPMRIDGQPVGVLQALNPDRARFDRADAEALLIIAAQAAVAIRNARHEAALIRANEQLSELDRLKTNFLSIASHELRTPLTAVQGFSQILAEEVRADLWEYADAISRAGVRMMNVVETLDVMASMEGDTASHPGILTSLASILADALSTEAPAATASLPDGPLLVDGHPERLALAFGNVLRNAVQFSEAGSPVRLAARVEADEIRVEITDEGRGLAPDTVDSIFEAYVQVQDPDHRDHEGLGLGLTVARAVISRHGGRIWAESEGLGQGTTIHVRLPVAIPGPGGDGAA